MEFSAQAHVKRILRTNHYLYSFEDAYRFINEENNQVRHFTSALRLSIRELPETYKIFFSSSRVLDRPWRDPGLEDLYKIAIRNHVPLSYSAQLINRINNFIFQSMKRRGYVYTFDKLLLSDKPVTPRPKYPQARFEDQKAANATSKTPNIFPSHIKSKDNKISELSEIELFDLLKAKCEEYNVPNALIPKLLPVLMKAAKTKNPPTILLTGSPGVGKTTLSRIISELLGLELCLVSAQSMATSRGLVGDSKTYRSARCGVIADAKQRFGDEFILILDEIDKVSLRRDSVHNIQDEVLSAIDGSRCIHDLYLDEDISTSTIFFILTANDEKAIPIWLKDRCTIIQFPDPDYDRVLNILSKRAHEMSENEPYEGRIIIRSDLIEQLVSHLFTQGQTSLRQYLAVLDDLYDKAYLNLLESRDSRVEISEDMLHTVLKDRTGNGRIRFGFEI